MVLSYVYIRISSHLQQSEAKLLGEMLLNGTKSVVDLDFVIDIYVHRLLYRWTMRGKAPSITTDPQRRTKYK